MANEAPNDDRLKKIFVGGLNRSTSNDGLKAYFESYGEMSDCVVITDSNTKESRGFGYVTFVDKESVIAVLQDKNEKGPHNIDGKDVEVKRAIPKDDDSQTARLKTKKLFIGGLKDEATAEDIKQSLTEAVRGIAPNSVDLIMKRADDTSSGPSKHRGFCFVEYEDEDLVDELCCIKKVNICGKFVELKKAEPKDKDSRGQGGRGGRGGGRGGYRGGRGGGRDQGGHGGYGGYPGGGYSQYGGYGDGSYGYENNGYDYYGMGAYQQSASGYGAQGGWGGGGNQRYRPY